MFFKGPDIQEAGGRAANITQQIPNGTIHRKENEPLLPKDTTVLINYVSLIFFIMILHLLFR